ncbi:MAG: hypothetical protein K2Q23_16825 [Bryobacteraceae bacterium]|nr:hypothetical protein [Bryobacteraceae bacterium]
MERREFLGAASAASLLAAPPPAIPMRAREDVKLREPFTRLVADMELDTLRGEVQIIKGVWPGIPRANQGAGPTGVAWIDSNAWRIAAARARSTQPAWVSFRAPKRVLAVSDYLVAIADCAASGAHWIADLSPAALEASAHAVAFFARHAAWRDWTSAGAIGVCGDNDDTHEIMNLLVRGHLPFRIVTAAPQLEGLRCLIAFDASALAPHRAELRAWIKAGGAIITNQAEFAGGPRVTLWKEEAVDPYLVAQAAKKTLGRDGEALRAYNMFTSNLRWTERADQKHALIELVNFTGRLLPDETTLWVRRSYRRVWLHTWNAAPRELTPLAAGGGTEIAIPEREVYAALELAA